MEIYHNDFEITFTNEADAESAKIIATNAINAMSVPGYAYNATEEFANSLCVEGNVLANEEYSFTSDDLLNVAVATIKAIAGSMKTASFSFKSGSADTYAESWAEGCFENGILTITSAYYPEGYSEFLTCPECGEAVERMDDYDPSKTYICPECGEEVDLSDQAPVNSKETFEIK